MPPSELINVRNFRDKFSGLVRNQRDRGLFNAQSEWPAEIQEEVANRCQIADELSFSNEAFVNPTLFHMLRQHREFNEDTERELLQQKRNEAAAELERQRLETISEIRNGVAEEEAQQEQNTHVATAEVDGGEDESMLLRVDISEGDGANGGEGHAMEVDTNTVEDAMARLAGGEDDKEKRPSTAPENNDNDNGNGNDNDSNNGNVTGNNDGQDVQTKGDQQEQEGEHKEAEETVAPAEGNNNEDEDMSSVDLQSTSTTQASEYEDAESDLEPPPKMQVVPKKITDVPVTVAQSDLPPGITHDILQNAIENSGYMRCTNIQLNKRRAVKPRPRIVEPPGVSELEIQFRKVKSLLDESTLASLRKANRRMIPTKYRLEVNFMSTRVQQEQQPPNLTPVADDEVILSVCLYNTKSANSKMEEYLVLGSQNLTVLRDAFYCISDFLVSHRDEQIENTKDKKVSSSYFFIENTFYNDMRSPTATDYSRVILEWANDPEKQEKNPKLRGLQSRLMDGARFLDLSVRLKQPYMFVHQGDCEHVMIFTDLRLLGPKDDQYVENYPKQVFRTRHMRHKCRMCSAYPAQYVTKNDFHSGMSPCYFCEKCYTPFHFDKDGNKLLEHDVFPYANVNLM